VRRSVPRFGAKSAAERPDPKSWPLSAADTKELARLVRKHGRDTIVSAAKEVPVRGRGRPPNGDQAYFERVALAAIYEQWIEEHRLDGSCKPVTDAMLTLYEIKYGDDPKKPDLEKFLRTYKRKLIPARRELQQLKAAQQRMRQSGKW
jgi:hypothetical protein